jgi:predicted NBD/HSP70 family sugar kinase
VRKEDTKYEKEGLLKYIGVDIGKRNFVVCVMDSNGSIIKETQLQ